MYARHLVLIFGLCACATGSPAVKTPTSSKDATPPTLAEIFVTCDPVSPNRRPQAFSFNNSLEQGPPNCGDCLAMADSIEAMCQEYPQYCPCFKQAFSTNCSQFFEQIRHGCKPDKKERIPVSGPLVQG